MASCSRAKKFHSDYKKTAFGDSIDIASMKILKEAYIEARDKNVIASPFGMFTLLSLYSAGAPGKIREEILKYHGSSNKNKFYKEYCNVIDNFSKIDSRYLAIYNKFFESDYHELQSAGRFAETTKQMLTDVESTNFEEREVSVKIINSQVFNMTQTQIQEAVPLSAIDASVVLTLINVVFTRGEWNTPFKAGDTKEGDFYLLDKKIVKKPMLHLTGSFFTFKNENLGYKMLELPYQEKGFRMVIVLPNKVDGLTGLIAKPEHGILGDVFKLAPSGAKINLRMPKFEIKSELDLYSILPKVGVSSIFNEGASDMVKDAIARATNSFHQAVIKVDDEGATASAFTGATAVQITSDDPPPKSYKVDHPFRFLLLQDEENVKGLMAPPASTSKPPAPIEYKVDHPFLFLILHEDKILFTGTYTH